MPSILRGFPCLASTIAISLILARGHDINRLADHLDRRSDHRGNDFANTSRQDEASDQ